jgi:hypothetical protein
MKKNLLFIILSLFAFSSFSQNAKPLKQINKLNFLENVNPSLQFLQNETNKKPSFRRPTFYKTNDSRADLNSILLGSAANMLTTLTSEDNVVYADNSLNTVVFIHRNNPDLFGQTSSQYRYDISSDRGVTFTNDIGPLNPTPTGTVGGVNARFPQLSFYNPTGNTNVNNAYLVYAGSWHNGGTGSDIWEGTVTGVARLDGTTGSWTETIDTTNGGLVGTAYSFCQGLPGEYWSVDNEQGVGTNDSMIVVYKGVWNTSTSDIDWGVFAKLNPNWTVTNDTTHKLSPLVSFSPDGQVGYIASCADYGSSTFRPFFFKTTDGGATWSSVITVDLTAFASITDSLDPAGTLVPLMGFDLDLVVDKNGAPHLIGVIGSGDAYAIQSGLSLNLYDITYTSGTNYGARLVSPVLTFRGQIAESSTGTAGYTQDNRPQGSVSPDGSKVFYVWSDSPINGAGGDNNLPDLFVSGYDVDLNKFSYIYNFSQGDLEFEGNCTFPSISPVTFSDASSNTIPVVITRKNDDGASESPATFYYLNNVIINNDDFINDAPNSIAPINAYISLDIFPNPANNKIIVSTSDIRDASIRITNLLGEVIYQFSYSGSNAQFDISELNTGVYNLEILSKDFSTTKRFVVAK